MPGRLLGVEADQEGFGGGLRDPPKDSMPQRPGGVGESGCFMGRSGVEPSRVADRSGGGSATEEQGMTASGRGRRSDSFEGQEGFALPGESVRLHRPVRSRGVAGCPRRKGSAPRSRRGGKDFSPGIIL